MAITKETILSLNKLLELEATGNEQDWPVEMADKDRVLDFINRFYLCEQLTANERYAIISLILCSYDDFLSSDLDKDNQIWGKILTLIEKNKNESEDILLYWANWEEKDSNNLFCITPLVREYIRKQNQ